MHLFLVLIALLSAATPAATTEGPPVEAVLAPVMIEIPDSVRAHFSSSENAPLVLEAQDIRARRIVREAGADRIELGQLLLESRDGGSVADLGTLLPSTHLTVNSRGEALFLVRGSQERHLRLELDGIPLTVPWDERTDLSLLPLTGVGSVVARRGVSSALDPPNTLAGRIELRTHRQTNPGAKTRLGFTAAEAGLFQGSLLHQRRDGDWTSTLAVEHRRRDGFLLPEGSTLEFHQDPTRRLRNNTDLEQTTALLHLGRDFDGVGSARLLIQASDSEKGVAPESHVDDARLWRIPDTRRLLVGVATDLQHGPWMLDAATSFDWFDQDIESYTDDRYTEIEAIEASQDRTWLGRSTLRRGWGERWSLTIRGSARRTNHRDNTGENTSELEFTQNLVAAGGELSYRPSDRWLFRAGSGYEGATTPLSGDKPSRNGDHELVWHAATERDLGSHGHLHAALSQRPRFVSLRELFSGALDRFEVNPELRPETQTLAELGWSRQARRLDLMVNFFASRIDDSIERIVLDDGRRQRVNLDEVRNLGVEFGFVIRPRQGLSFDWQHTQLASRKKIDGSFDQRVEDRPDWLTTFAASWVHRSGWQLRSELVGVGPRFSLDQRLPSDTNQLTKIDTDLRFNTRVAWRHFGHGWYAGSELFVRVDNIFDTPTDSQLGLPESGRTLRLGLKVDLRS